MNPVRFSHLKYMSRTPMHFRWALDNVVEETLAMRLGSGAHAALFEQPIAVFTGKVRNGAKWQEFEAEHAGQCILNVREYDQANRIADAVREHDLAYTLIFATDAVREQRVYWEQLGLKRCGTPDVRTARYIVDLKTTKCADPARFARDGAFRSYHAQLADYTDGVSLSGLGTPAEAYIVAVESSPPHPVTVLRLTDNAIDQGRRLCRVWMERLLTCERANHWPGYVEGIVDFDVDVPLELEFGDDEEAA